MNRYKKALLEAQEKIDCQDDEIIGVEDKIKDLEQ